MLNGKLCVAGCSMEINLLTPKNVFSRCCAAAATPSSSFIILHFPLLTRLAFACSSRKPTTTTTTSQHRERESRMESFFFISFIAQFFCICFVIVTNFQNNGIHIHPPPKKPAIDSGENFPTIFSLLSAPFTSPGKYRFS